MDDKPKLKAAAKLKKPGTPKKPRERFGIGEWYGKSFVAMTPAERKLYAEAQFKAPDKPVPCRFLVTSENPDAHCKLKNTRGGICSLRAYSESEHGTIDPNESTLRTTCPNRFVEDGEVYRWIGEVILGDPNAVPVGQTPFLERVALIGEDPEKVKAKAVGRMDNVLVRPGTNPLQWCAVEMQAVYFSGKKMGHLFEQIVNAEGGLVFPSLNRRPDYRSSAPKRLLPQLQIKVPHLLTWGMKMAVVVDEDFFKALGPMEQVEHLSNAHVVWFVVRYEDAGNAEIKLRRGFTYMTTLDGARSGLIAGKAPSRESFEAKLLERLAKGGAQPGLVEEDLDEDDLAEPTEDPGQ